MAASYNLKLIEYPNGSTQLRYYKNGISDKSVKDNDDVLDILDDVTDNVFVPDYFIDKNNLRSFTSSLNRSRNTIMQYARSNQWDIFVTLTFSSVYDRTDYLFLLNKLRKWLDNLKSRKCPDLAYLIVPEEHKNIEVNGKRAYHFHGLFANIDGLSLTPAFSPSGRALFTNKGLRIYNLSDYKLGFSTATYVTDTFRCTTYITKYVTKALCIRQKFKRRFLCSHNLNKPIVRNIGICNIDDIFKFYAISYEKTIDVKCGSFEDTVTFLEVDKLDNSLSVDDIVNGLTDCYNLFYKCSTDS